MRRLCQLSFRGLAKQRIIAEDDAECKKFLLVRVRRLEGATQPGRDISKFSWKNVSAAQCSLQDELTDGACGLLIGRPVYIIS
jgi:hypothetical protein